MVPRRSPDEPLGEPIPNELVTQAQAVFNRSRPGELAGLVGDTLVDADAPADRHHLRFEHPSVRIEIEVSARETGSTLRGEVQPRAAVRVELQFDGSDGGIVAQAPDGAFQFGPIDHGLVRVCVSGLADPPVVRTDWFRI
jgi:hypothetical protein